MFNQLWLFPILLIYVRSQETDEESCLNRLKTGESFNLTNLIGDWYSLYGWPAAIRKKDQCDTVSFSHIKRSKIECKENIPENEEILKSSYNISYHETKFYYYGSGEVKYQIRGCDADEGTVKILMADLGDGYVLMTHCGFGFENLMGTLIASHLPSASDLQAVVDSIDVLKDRKGGVYCHIY